MGSRRREKSSRSDRRSRSRSKQDKKHNTRSDSSESYHKKKRSRSGSSSPYSNSAKNLYKEDKNMNPIEDFDQEYFFRMSRRIQDDFKEEMDRELFTANLYSQLDGKEIGLAFYKQPSICIQWLIENASGPEEIKKLSEKIPAKKFTLEFVNNQFSSHVIQSLIEACLKVLSRECTLNFSDQRNFKWSINYILDVAEFLIDNLNNVLHDTNGSHVVTTVMEALGGIRVGRHRSRKAMGFGQKTNINTEIEKDIVIKELPSNLKSMLKKLTKTLILDREEADLREAINGKATSIIQYLLFILKIRANDLCQTIVKKMIDLVFGNQENKVAVISNSNCAYLVETIILVSSEHRLRKIWEKHLKGSLRDMWKDDIANFIVQRLVDAAMSEELYQNVSFEILPHLASIFTYNRPGIGVCLAKATLKFPQLQQEFIFAIMKAFHCYEPKEKQIHLIPLMLFGENTVITPSSNNQKVSKSGQIWLHGSLMLQYMFQYEDPYKLSKSLLSLEPRELVCICNDKSGSHVIDAFLKSPTVPDKARLAFVDRLSGYFVQLACDKFGSRVIDNILSSVNIKTKQQIMDEFSAKEAQLQNNKSGYYISKNVGLYHYKHRFNEWKDNELSKERKKKTFHDLIDEPRHDKYDNSSHYRHSSSSSSYDHFSNNDHHISHNRNKDYNNGHSGHFKRPRAFKSSPYYNRMKY